METAGTQGMRAWISLAITVLLVAGGFAVLLVFARLPPFDTLITDPGFFRRCLVFHVNLALVAWFVSFAAGLVSLLPGAAAPWTRAGVWVAGGGIATMALAVGNPDAAPILSNYIPMIDDPAFAGGQLLFGVGVLLSVVDGRLVREARTQLPPAVIPGLRAVAVALLIAALTFGGSWLTRPVGATPELYWELLNWGIGHTLQLVSVAAMISVWLLLVTDATGQAPLRRSTSAALFAVLLLPWMGAPLLAISGTSSSTYHTGFTTLMRWGIFPVATVFAGVCLVALRQAWAEGRIRLADPRVNGFLVSVSLTLLGFVLGGLIRGSNTIVPGHYHASIGAVTAAFMAVTHPLLDRAGLPAARPSRVAGWQPLIFGAGQMVFAGGFALAGAWGAARKVYGAEQAGRGLVETVGLGIMGLGGLVAVAGGLLFLWGVFQRWTALSPKPWSAHDRNPRNTPSAAADG